MGLEKTKDDKLSINLNDNISVKLNELGLKIYQDHLNEFTNIKVPEPDIYGRHEFQLWDFMYIFGKHTYIGKKPVVEKCEITLVNRC